VNRKCFSMHRMLFSLALTIKWKVPRRIATLSAFKAACLFSQKAHIMQPRAVDLDSLKSFPFFSDDVIKGLKDELPVYLSKCTDTDPDSCPLEWWKRNSGDIPTWSACARKVLLVQPSSAASERVFSITTGFFSRAARQFPPRLY
jgi:hypothetical protein